MLYIHFFWDTSNKNSKKKPKNISFIFIRNVCVCARYKICTKINLWRRYNAIYLKIENNFEKMDRSTHSCYVARLCHFCCCCCLLMKKNPFGRCVVVVMIRKLFTVVVDVVISRFLIFFRVFFKNICVLFNFFSFRNVVHIFVLFYNLYVLIIIFHFLLFFNLKNKRNNFLFRHECIS